MFEPSYTHNILRFAELVVMGAVGIALIQCQSYVAIVVGSILIGLMQGRSGWMQHESGHMSLTGSPKWDRILHALFFGKPERTVGVVKTLEFLLSLPIGLGLGLSSSWWSSKSSASQTKRIFSSN